MYPLGVFHNDQECIQFCFENIAVSTVTSRNESMPLLGSINEGQLGNVKAAKAQKNNIVPHALLTHATWCFAQIISTL